MRNTVTILLTCLVSVGAYFLITYRLSSSSVFADDFARDLYDILDITRGKLTLLGPSLSFGGLRAGPYYYYLFAPIFALSRADINSVLYFNAGLFAAALGYFYYKLAPRVGSVRGLAAVGIIALSPVYLYGARTPSNGFSFLPLLFIFLIQIMIKDNFSLRGLLLLGILGGVVVNFHFVTLPLFAVLFLVILRQLKDKLKILFFTLGFGLTFLPLLFFEVRHNFVMTRTTLSLKDAWLENRNLRDLPDSILPDKYIPNNFFIILGQTKRWLAVEPLILFGLGGLFIWTERKRTRTGVMFLSCVGIFFLLAIFLAIFFLVSLFLTARLLEIVILALLEAVALAFTPLFPFSALLPALFLAILPALFFDMDRARHHVLINFWIVL